MADDQVQWNKGTQPKDVPTALVKMLTGLAASLPTQAGGRTARLVVTRTKAAVKGSPCGCTTAEAAHKAGIAVHVRAVVLDEGKKEVGPAVTARDLADFLIAAGFTGIGEHYDGAVERAYVHADIRGQGEVNSEGPFAPGGEHSKAHCWSVVFEGTRCLDGIRLQGGPRPGASEPTPA